MELILTKDIEHLGKFGDVVNVKQGYARNYLLPRKLAVEATEGNKKAIEKKRLEIDKQEEQKRKEAEALVKKIEKLSLTASVQVGENEKLYGSVTTQDIAGLLKEEGFDIDKKKIELENPIKALGVYNAKIKLDPEVTATVKVWVVKE